CGPMLGVRVGGGLVDGGVVGRGVALHRARRRWGDGHGHRQHGEQHCAKNCQGPRDPSNPEESSHEWTCPAMHEHFDLR
ncbi:hypothetical protein, partial [Methylobacterium ajmalii]|uniref:hypothetical protein n=1 Tax=Methylobacterium ajmalii TaxID=2738439 RepID=UPI001AEDAE1E